MSFHSMGRRSGSHHSQFQRVGGSLPWATAWLSPRSVLNKLGRLFGTEAKASGRGRAADMPAWVEPMEPRVMLAANLAIQNLNWNIVGLDSNNVNAGTNTFLVGARVTNTGADPATNVNVNFAFDESPVGTPIHLVAGTSSSRTLTSLAAGDHKDFYFYVQVDRIATAYNKTRDYHISAGADNASAVQTPAGWEFYVEHLVSQNRNATTSIIAPSTVLKGSTFSIVHNAKTATSGYEQMTSELTLNPDVFEILSTSATYSAPAGGTNDHLYADAANWDNDPTSPTYRQVLGTGKAGGTVVTNYLIRVRDTAPVGAYTVTGLIYDFSGSSYHYNADSGINFITINVKGATGTAVGDKVFEDTNGDGIQQNTEPGVANATVALYSNTNVLIGSVTTGADGSYLFDDTNVAGGIPTSTYSGFYVQYTLPASSTYVFTAADQGSDDTLDSDASVTVSATSKKTAVFALTAGQQVTSYDAGMYRPVTISGETWRDNNGDGAQAGGDQGVGPFTINLYDAATNALVATTTSAASGGSAGLYSLSGVRPGTFYATFSLPSGQGYTIKDKSGQTEDKDSDVNPGTGRTDVFTISSNGTLANLDAGYTNSNSIGDTVWFDANSNGIQDPGESGIDGVTVNLRNASTNALVSTATTANGGVFSFTPSNSTYYLEFVLPAGYAFTAKDQGSDDFVDSDADTTTGRTANITVTSSTGSDFKWDAGLKSVGYIGDRVWHDSDGSGTVNGVESGLANVRLNLYLEPAALPDDLDGDEVLIATTTTDASGNYQFSNLRAGTYWVEVDETTLPAGYLSTTGDTTQMVTLTNASLPGSLQVSTRDFGFTNASVTATKNDALQADNDSSGTVTPGDRLRYTVVVTNTSPVTAGLVTLTDLFPDSRLTLVVGSVTTTKGSVVTGNTSGDTTIDVLVGNLASAGTVTITFDALISNPLGVGASSIYNQGTVSGSNFTTVVTDDPGTVTSDDATYTAVSAAPVIAANDTDSLFNDADSSTTVTAGDTILYTVVVTNTGNQDAGSVNFSDLITDPSLQLIAGSVTTSQGTVTTGNTMGDTTVGVNLGTLAGVTGTATITFKVLVLSVSATTNFVYDQGTVSGSNFTSVVTNDPDTGAALDATATPVTGYPVVAATKSAALFIDADSSSSATGGDTLRYTVVITNSGNRDAGSVVLTDLLSDPNLHLVVGSVSTTLGSVATGNTSGDTTVVVNVGNLDGLGATATIIFDVLVGSVPVGVTSVSNQGDVSGNNFTTIPTDDPSTVTSDDPTVVAVSGTPDVSAVKHGHLDVDSDGNSAISPGDTLHYIITITNDGSGHADSVQFQDLLPDANLILVAGSVTSTLGTILTGNTMGDTTILVDIGDIPGLGDVVTIEFRALISMSTPSGGTVTNQGTITGGNIPSTPTDDPSTGAPNDPTVVTMGTTAPDLKITVSDGVATAAPGDTLTYTLTISNLAGDATGVVATSQLPTNVVNFVSASGGGTYNAGTGVVTWNIGSLASGGSTTRTVTVTVKSAVPAGVTSFENHVAVTDDGLNGADTDLSNNTDVNPDTLNAAPDLKVTVSDGVATAYNGNTLTYHLTVTNTGNQNATGVVLTDTLPSGVSFVSSTGSGTESSGVITWNLGDLAVGDTVTYDVVVTVTTSSTGSLTYTINAADDGSNGADLNSSDNTASDVDTLNPTPLSLSTPTFTITKTSESATAGSRVAIGEVIRYRAVFQIPESNYNNMVARAFLPSGLEFLPGSGDIAFWSTVAGNITSSNFSGPSLNSNETTPLSSLLPSFGLTGTEQNSGGGFTDGEDVLFNLGTVTNAESDANIEYIVIEFNALVLNTSATSHATTFSVTADLTNTVVGGPVTTTVYEPLLDIHNVVTVNGSGTYGTDGDDVVYTYIIEHDDFTRAHAYDLNITSSIPSTISGLSIVSASIFDTSNNSTTDVTSLFGFSGNNFETLGDIDLLTTQTLTIKISGVIDMPAAGVDIADNVFLTWTGLDGSHGTTGNATGSDTPGASGSLTGERDGSGTLSGLNDYYDFATSTITTPNVDFSNVTVTYTGVTPLQPGKTGSATVTYRNSGSTTGGAHTIKLYRSYDGSSLDRLLATYSASPLLPGTRSVPLSWTATLADSDADSNNNGTATSYLLAVIDSEDAVGETNEANNIGSTFQNYTVTVPVVTIRPAGSSGSDLTSVEGVKNSGRFLLERTGSTSSPLTVTIDWTGTSSADDFTGGVYPATTVTFKAGASTAAVYVTPILDVNTTASESAPETLIATIRPSTDNPKAYLVGGTSQTMTIQDVVPTVSIAVTDALATEQNQTPGSWRITRTRTGGITQPLTVTLDFGGTATYADDYHIYIGTQRQTLTGTTLAVTIPANKTTADIRLVPVNDFVRESDKTVVATLLPDSAVVARYGLGNNTGTVTIKDDDWVNLAVLITAKTQKVYTPTNTGPNKIPIVTLTISNTSSVDSLPTTFQVKLIAAGQSLNAQSFEEATYSFPFVGFDRIRAGKSVTKTFLIRFSFLDPLPKGVYYAAVKVDSGNAMDESSETDNYGFSRSQYIVI